MDEIFLEYLGGKDAIRWDKQAKETGFVIVEPGNEYHKNLEPNIYLCMYDISCAGVEWIVKLMLAHGGLFVAAVELYRFADFDSAITYSNREKIDRYIPESWRYEETEEDES